MLWAVLLIVGTVWTLRGRDVIERDEGEDEELMLLSGGGTEVRSGPRLVSTVRFSARFKYVLLIQLVPSESKFES